MKIFITGDTHGNIDTKKLNTKKWPEQKTLTRDDVLIVAGDFGCPWQSMDTPEDRYWLDWYENKPCTTLFIDGNHENFDVLEQLPIVEFCGAKCHKLRDHVLHIMRGEILHIAGHSIWCMGGARSTDKIFRTQGISWWPQEIPTYEECDRALQSFISEKPDVIITHEGPSELILKLYEHCSDQHTDTVSNFMQEILNRCRELKISPEWFMGHHHIDKDYEIEGGPTIHMLYQNIIELK